MEEQKKSLKERWLYWQEEHPDLAQTITVLVILAVLLALTAMYFNPKTLIP